MVPNRVNRAHWPTTENLQNSVVAFFRSMEQLMKNCTKWGREGSFPTNLDLADILGRTDFDSVDFHFLDFGSGISGSPARLTGVLKAFFP